MSFLKPKNQTKFCLHFSNRSFSFVLLLLMLSQIIQKKYVFYKKNGNNCSGDVCLHISSFVIFYFQYFKDLSTTFKFTNYDVAYSDFNQFNGKLFSRHNSRLLPDWSPERYLQMNYLGPVVAIKTSRLESKIAKEDFAFFERIFDANVKKLDHPGYKSFSRKEFSKPQNIDYVSQILSKNNSSVRAFMQSDGKIKLSYRKLAPKRISIVIPTRGTTNNESSYAMVCNLAKTINSQITNDKEIEVVVVYDDDTNLDYLRELEAIATNFQLQTIAYRPPFNFSKKCNLGAKHSSGEVILFLNDDTEFISQDGLIELAGAAMTSNTGAVGAKLYFANDSIQHAGTIVIGGNLGHAYFKESNPIGLHGDLDTIHEVSAVTGACLAMRKEIWEISNGWNEQFDNSYNDVEFCFRLRDLGFRILQNNFVELYHFESITRDASYSPEAKSLLESKWNDFLQDDVYFPQLVHKQPKLFKLIKRFIRQLIKRLGIKR